jgi:excisionase family DNA binding protein
MSEPVEIVHPPSMSIAQVAAAAGCSTATIGRWIQQGRIKAFRVGPRTVRVPIAEVERLINGVPAMGGNDAA